MTIYCYWSSNSVVESVSLCKGYDSNSCILEEPKVQL